MRWVCRPRPDVDVLASIWLVGRYVDHDVIIEFRSETSDGDAGGGRFDLVDHRTDLTVFESLIADHDLSSHSPLRRMAVIIRAATFDDELDLDLAGLGVGIIAVGARSAERDDAQLIARTAFIFDALLAWCEADVGPSSIR